LRYITVLIVVILLGFGLRLYTLDHLPLIVDEIGFAARASDMLHGQRIPIFAPGHNGNPAVFSWLLAGSMDLFGQNRFAMRLIPLAFGTLSIPAAYALGRAWWSPRVGLIAAAFLATYPAQVYFSRLALYNIVDPFFALLALAVLARALRQMRLADFALAGVSAGIAQYFYHGSRLLPVLMIVYAIIHSLNAKAQGRKDAKIIQSLCVMLFAFILVSLPRFSPMFTADLPLTGNLNAIRLPADLGANTLRSVLAWVGQPDVSPFWLSDVPLLPFFALLAGAVGLVICLRHLRDARHMVIVLTLMLTTIFGGMIWTASPLYVRYMTALPAIVLLVALPFERIQTQKMNRQVAKHGKTIQSNQPRLFNSLPRLRLRRGHVFKRANSLPHMSVFAPPLYAMERGLGGEDEGEITPAYFLNSKGVLSSACLRGRVGVGVYRIVAGDGRLIAGDYEGVSS
jgi:4-amino-4-deoxy-L-arabinose transferase-like glycosyltransferase